MNFDSIFWAQPNIIFIKRNCFEFYKIVCVHEIQQEFQKLLISHRLHLHFNRMYRSWNLFTLNFGVSGLFKCFKWMRYVNQISIKIVWKKMKVQSIVSPVSQKGMNIFVKSFSETMDKKMIFQNKVNDLDSIFECHSNLNLRD